MSDVWVLSVKTSLPNVCENSSDMPIFFEVFDSFEKGRDALRRVVKEFAFSENSMFDCKGNITYFQEYIKDAFDDDDDDEEDEFLGKKNLTYITEALRKAFAGEGGNNAVFEMKHDFYEGYLIAADCDQNCLSIYGYEDGPINGVDPIIKTNIFTMQTEQHYYLYIDDMFRQDCSSELYIDLKKAALQ